jgi:hypothetical protein
VQFDKKWTKGLFINSCFIPDSWTESLFQNIE